MAIVFVDEVQGVCQTVRGRGGEDQADCVRLLAKPTHVNM